MPTLPRSWIAAGSALLLASLSCAPLAPTDLFATEVRAALGPIRPFHLRLAVDLGYAQCDDHQPISAQAIRCTAPPDLGSRSQRKLHRQALKAVRGISDRSSPDALHAAALWSLLFTVEDGSALDRALGFLETAHGQAPTDVALLNDLGVARFLAGRMRKAPWETLRSVALFQQAVELDPSFEAARFNRALAFDEMSLVKSATAEWTELAAASPLSPWTAEARDRLSSEPAPDRDAAFKRALKSAIQPPLGIAALVARFPELSYRYLLDEAVPAWGRAYSASDDDRAVAALRIAERFARELAERLGDSLGSGVVEHIRATRSNPARGTLAGALADYGVGRKEQLAKALDAARLHLSAASSALHRLGNPMALRADLWLSIIAIDSEDHFTALAILTQMSEATDLEAYPLLAGRILWHRGVSLTRQGFDAKSLATFREARELFERSDFAESVGFLDHLIADDLASLGNPSLCWQHRFQAIRGLAGMPKTVAAHNSLAGAAQTAGQQGLLEVAIVLLDEAVALALERGRPSSSTEAFLMRARWHAKLEHPAAASRDMALALEHAARIPESPFKDRVLHMVRLDQARFAAERSPEQAIAKLGELKATYRRQRFHLRLGETYLERARILRQLERHDESAAELDAAIGLMQTESRTIENIEQRYGHARVAQRLFEEMVALQLDHRGDTEAALAYAECARMFAFGGLVFERLGLDPTASCTRLIESLRAGAATMPLDESIIELMVLPRRLVLWHISRAGITHRVVDQPTAALSALSDDFVTAVRQEDDAVLHATGRDLAARLLEPWIDSRAGLRHLTIVPDRFLAGVPFAALTLDSGRFLIEELSVSVTPSALTSFSHPTAAGPAQVGGDVLLVADPEFAPQAFPGLGRLNAAEQEVRHIEELYARPAELSRPAVLRGAGATRQAIEPRLTKIRMLHYAGHAVADLEHPFRSYLVMAQDSAGEDPRLSAADIISQPMDKLDIAVLSACTTAGSRGERGAGLPGLGMAFLLSGARAVAATLWPIVDDATAPLMVDFHRQLAQGVPARHALRHAQLASLASDDPRRRAPASWSAFIVMEGLLMRRGAS